VGESNGSKTFVQHIFLHTLSDSKGREAACFASPLLDLQEVSITSGRQTHCLFFCVCL
jgi:hypothetical protein